MNINFRPVIRVVGVLFVIVGAMIWTCLPFAFYYKDGDSTAIVLSGLIALVVGGGLWFSQPKTGNKLGKKEGYLIVALGWLALSFISMLPYLVSGIIPNFSDAFFESVSGLTTTGATILTDIESVPKGILFWRSLTQWIGGMGIIVLTVAIFPLLGIGGIELFEAEAPGPTADKIHPRIQETAKRLWLIYVSLTALLCTILCFVGMNFYDAINHALTTMATGGFSTKNASMAHFSSPLIQYIIILFMFIAGTNYTITYFALTRRFKRVWQSEEFRYYSLIVLLLTVGLSTAVYFIGDASLEKSFRDVLFQVVSLITTTGYITADYTAWGSGVTAIFFVLLFLGASAGSTSGGIKIIRHLVFFKNSALEFKRILHPRAMIRLKINKSIVAPRILTHILVFLLIYLAVFVIGTIVVTTMGLDLLSAAGAVATSVGNVGPGIGSVGPIDNFAHLSAPIKLFLSFLMLLGRLELFTILILFTPYFWKSN